MTRPVHISRRRVLVVTAIVVFALGVGLAAAIGLFGGGTPSSAAGIDNGSPTSLTTVTRQDLSSQTQVSATLGYAEPSTIVAPAGTAPVGPAAGAAGGDDGRGQLAAAQPRLDRRFGGARAGRRRAGGRPAKLSVDCAGDAAGQSPPPRRPPPPAWQRLTPCATDAQSVSTDEQGVDQADAKVATDRQAVASAAAAASPAPARLAVAEASATVYGTELDVHRCCRRSGQIVRRGRRAVRDQRRAGRPALRPVAAWRAFVPGMSPGRDVAELNAQPARARLRRRAPATRSPRRPTLAIERVPVGARPAADRASCCSARSCSSRGAVRVTSVTPTVGATGAAGAGARDHLDSPRGDDRARRSAAGEHQGRRPGHDHAARQRDDAGPRLLSSAPSRRAAELRPAAATAARARRRSRSTSRRPIRPRPVGSTRRRSTSRSRPRASATRSSCR